MRERTGFLPMSKYRSTKSMEFNGTDDWMVMLTGFGVPTFPIRKYNRASVSIWVKSTKDDGSDLQVIMSRWFPYPSFPIDEGGWRIYLTDAQGGLNPLVDRAIVVQLSTHALQGLWVYSKDSFPLNEWVHICFTYDGSGTLGGLNLYWNGVLKDTWTIWGTWTTNALNSNGYSSLLWGSQYTCWYPGGGYPDDPPVLRYWFEGVMDETSVWNVDLSAEEVLRLYNCGKPENPMHVGLPNDKHCSTHWRMGERADTAWILNMGVCNSRFPVTGIDRNTFWNNYDTDRIVEDVSS